MFDIIIQYISGPDESTLSGGKDLSALRSVYCGLVLCRFLVLFIKQLLCQLFFTPTCWLSLLTIVRPFFFQLPVKHMSVYFYLAAVNWTLCSIVLLFFIGIPVCVLLFGFLMTSAHPLQLLHRWKILYAHILNFPTEKVWGISWLQ